MAEVKEPIEVKKKRKRIQLLDSDSGSDEEYRPDSTGNFFKINSSMIVFFYVKFNLLQSRMKVMRNILRMKLHQRRNPN